MSFVRKNIEEMEGYAPGEQINRDVIKLNTNENPYPPSPRVCEILAAHPSDDLKLYPDPKAESLCEEASKRYTFPVEGIMAGNGSDDLLTIIFRAFLDRGDSVASFYPTYTLYETLARIQDAELVYTDFTPLFGIPETFSDASAKFVILANPNSPSGTLIPSEAVKKLAEAVTGVLVIDEAYADFARENCMDLAKELDNVIVLRSFSKSFSLAGIRLGLAFSTPEIIRQLMKVKDSYNVNRLSMQAGTEALKDYEWMRKNVSAIISTREKLINGLEDLGLDPLPSESNFVFVKCPGEQAANLYRLLKERNILVRYFDRERTREYLRITVGTEEQVQELLSEISDILSSVRQETQ